jgi:diadenosine tetraphosphatase ApaH/serine/threonine PP2A family protein phosphatase
MACRIRVCRYTRRVSLPLVRALIVSDVHSNIEALDAVCAEAESLGGFDHVWCAGDIVGYGADPAAVIDRLRSFDLTAVAGNHDLAACGRMTTADFNPVAAAAAQWTGSALSPEHRAWLESLPLITQPTTAAEAFTIVHGSLREPEWEYLLDEMQAEAQFEIQQTRYCVIGHSHLQLWFYESKDRPVGRAAAFDGGQLRLTEDRLIINPGSTGQPRDGDPRAAFALYDSDRETITWHRAEYDVEAAAAKIIAAGLPAFLASRLKVGR